MRNAANELAEHVDFFDKFKASWLKYVVGNGLESSKAIAPKFRYEAPLFADTFYVRFSFSPKEQTAYIHFGKVENPGRPNEKDGPVRHVFAFSEDGNISTIEGTSLASIHSERGMKDHYSYYLLDMANNA